MPTRTAPELWVLHQAIIARANATSRRVRSLDAIIRDYSRPASPDGAPKTLRFALHAKSVRSDHSDRSSRLFICTREYAYSLLSARRGPPFMDLSKIKRESARARAREREREREREG
jgi:hypothetical protein